MLQGCKNVQCRLMLLVLGVQVDVGDSTVLRVDIVLEMVDNNGSFVILARVVLTRSRFSLSPLDC